MKSLLCAAALACLSAGSAHAALVTYVFETPGGGSTTWVFSGSATAGGSGYFDDANNLGNSDAWTNFGEFTGINDLEVDDFLSKSLMLTIGSETRAVDTLYIDSDLGGNTDDWGVGVTGSTNFEFEAGDLLSWSGTLVTDRILITDLDNSGLPVVFTDSRYGGDAGLLPFELHIGVMPPAPAVVPLPASGLLLAGVLGGMAALRRRR